MSAYNFGGSGRNLTKLPGEVARNLGDQLDTNFTRGAPTKFGRAKMPKIRRDF